jgi:hypothetical protein
MLRERPSEPGSHSFLERALNLLCCCSLLVAKAWQQASDVQMTINSHWNHLLYSLDSGSKYEVHTECISQAQSQLPCSLFVPGLHGRKSFTQPQARKPCQPQSCTSLHSPPASHNPPSVTIFQVRAYMPFEQ